MITIYVQKTQAKAELDTPLTNGSVGLEAQFNFSSDWDGLSRTVVFETSEYYKEIVEIGSEDTAIVPENVMLQSGVKLYIGVYGTDNESNIVVPTVYADCGEIKRGANTEPGGTPVNPSQAVILQNQIDDLDSRVDTLEMGGVGGAGANVFVGDENTTSAEFYEAFSAKKPCFMLRANAGSGVVMWVVYNCTHSAARFYQVTNSGVVQYGTLRGRVFEFGAAEGGGSANVFIGDANTTVAEFAEADNAGKVCFMKRPQGGSGTVTWVAYNCSASGAWFYHVNSSGKVEYGHLVSDGSWSYTSVSTDLDPTLTQSGKAADAKAVGDALANISGANWLDPEPGEEFTVIVPAPTLTGITASYTGGDVVIGTALSALVGIVVTASYSDGTSKTVTDYTLSGSIAEGSNTITVSYGGKTTTFTVTGEAEDEPVVVENGVNFFTLDGFNTDGYYNADTGVFQTDHNLGSCYIPVVAGKEIAFNGLSACFFDAEKNYVSGLSYNATHPRTAVVPAGAKYIAFVIDKGKKETGYIYYLPFSYDEVSLGVNLLENMTYTDGLYVDNDGSIKENADFCYSERIPVVPALKFTKSSNVIGVKFATKYDGFITAKDGTVPYGAEYAIVNTYVASKDTASFVLTAE